MWIVSQLNDTKVPLTTVVQLVSVSNRVVLAAAVSGC